MFSVGPYGSLIGAPAAGLVAAASSGATVTLDGPLRYLLVNKAAPLTPFVGIHGWTTVDRPGRELAVVVNGVVAGVSVSYRAPDSDRVEFWSTLVPRFFHNGGNQVEVYEVSGRASAPSLALVTDVTPPP